MQTVTTPATIAPTTISPTTATLSMEGPPMSAIAGPAHA